MFMFAAKMLTMTYFKMLKQEISIVKLRSRFYDVLRKQVFCDVQVCYDLSAFNSACVRVTALVFVV